MDNTPGVKSASQDVSRDNLAAPIVGDDSQEVTIPYTNSDYIVDNSLQDITIGSQDIATESNLANASSNSDITIPMIHNTLDTEAKGISHVVTAPSSHYITIPTLNTVSYTASDTINITPLVSQDNTVGSSIITSDIQPDASSAVDSDDTIIIIQLDYTDPTTAPASTSNDSAGTSSILNETTAITQGPLNKRTKIPSLSRNKWSPIQGQCQHVLHHISS